EPARGGRGLPPGSTGRPAHGRRDHAVRRRTDRAGRLREPVAPQGVRVPRRVPLLRLLGPCPPGDLRRRRPNHLRRPRAREPRTEAGLCGRLDHLNQTVAEGTTKFVRWVSEAQPTTRACDWWVALRLPTLQRLSAKM